MPSNTNSTPTSAVQSKLSEDTLICEDCSPPFDAVHLERTEEASDEQGDYEFFECPECGEEGHILVRPGSKTPIYRGCVTTYRLLELEKLNAWARTNGGRY
ncbi:hypothetical protein [Natronoarchaeum rubrum]|uniref:hypothetical protein n=1 Tax=Natronoarchaeum rubrum TaxID=755311 RepID=UPI002111BDCB|nr:hypothetical protein [Natronoarchaeum rubrum]